MIDIKVNDQEKRVYIDISGYVSSSSLKNFMNDYKQQIKGIKTNQYKLVVTPTVFECENEDDIKKVCMTFYKAGYKRIYLVDPQNYILSNISLSSFERKLFLKGIKVISTKADVL